MKALWIEAANAKAFVRTRDHPPPHVHVVNRADRWEARVGFSFLTDRVWLMDVTPMANSPTTAKLNAIVAAVAGRLDSFPEDWWAAYGDADLTNRWIRIVPESMGALVVELDQRRKGAIQILSALYDPPRQGLVLVTSDGQRFELSAGGGRRP